jgi:hypothetical protein
MGAIGGTVGAQGALEFGVPTMVGWSETSVVLIGWS